MPADLVMDMLMIHTEAEKYKQELREIGRGKFAPGGKVPGLPPGKQVDARAEKYKQELMDKEMKKVKK